MAMKWDSDKHPRHPAGAPRSQGGQFSRKSGVEASLTSRLRKPDGGFSVDLRDNSEPTTGFIVSIYPERSWATDLKDLTPSNVIDFVIRNRDLLTQRGNLLGGWHDPDTGRIFLDVSRHTSSRKEAEELSLKHDQLAYFDLQAGKSVTVNRNATSGGAVKH